MKRAVLSSLLAVALAALAPPSALAHKFHASLAEVEYVPSTHVVEISIRVFPDDLEEALAKRTRKKVRLDATPDVDQLAEEYVRSAFVLSDPSKGVLDLHWVGMETKADSAWIYVQATSDAGLEGVRLHDRVFFDLFPDQVNTVNVKQGSAEATLVFKTGDAEQTIELPPE